MMKGPFYVKDADGNYILCENCRECSFESDEVCYTNPCIYFLDTGDGENVEDAT